MSPSIPDEHHHALIARPAGLPGYAPQKWCCVCGKSSSNGATLDCTEAACPNTCHAVCLGGGDNFNCVQVPHLRQALNIPDVVVYVGAARSDEQELAEPEN